MKLNDIHNLLNKELARLMADGWRIDLPHMEQNWKCFRFPMLKDGQKMTLILRDIDTMRTDEVYCRFRMELVEEIGSLVITLGDFWGIGYDWEHAWFYTTLGEYKTAIKKQLSRDRGYYSSHTEKQLSAKAVLNAYKATSRVNGFKTKHPKWVRAEHLNDGGVRYVIGFADTRHLLTIGYDYYTNKSEIIH